MPANNNSIVVVYKLTFAAIFHFYGFFAYPGEFQHRSVRIGRRPRNSTASHHIASIYGASVYGMVCQLLRHIPVNMLKIGLAYNGFFGVFWLNGYLKINIEAFLSFVL